MVSIISYKQKAFVTLESVFSDAGLIRRDWVVPLS